MSARLCGFLLVLLAWSALAIVPKPMQIKVDHASVCGSHLDTLRAGFASVGLTTDYGGPHAHGGTQMALLGFDDGSYLELIAPQKASMAADSGWAKMIAGDSGACAWAIGTHNLQDDLARFRRQGMNVEGPAPGSRTRPDGKVIEWETATVGPGAPGATLPFMIQDKTAREMRVQPSASVKNSGLLGIAIVILGVNDLDASAGLFRSAYGWQTPRTEDHPEFGAKLAYFPGSPVILAAPSGGHSWLSERLKNFGESPIAYLLGTSDIGAANTRYKLSSKSKWFDRDLAWFDPQKLSGVRLGVIQ